MTSRQRTERQILPSQRPAPTFRKDTSKHRHHGFSEYSHDFIEKDVHVVVFEHEDRYDDKNGSEVLGPFTHAEDAMLGHINAWTRRVRIWSDTRRYGALTAESTSWLLYLSIWERDTTLGWRTAHYKAEGTKPTKALMNLRCLSISSSALLVDSSH